MKRHQVLPALTLCLLVVATAGASAQPLPPAPPYNYCPESTQHLYLMVPRVGGLTLVDDMLARVAKDWSMDRGLVLLHYGFWRGTEAPEVQRQMRQALDEVIAALVGAGVPGRDDPGALVFALLPTTARRVGRKDVAGSATEPSAWSAEPLPKTCGTSEIQGGFRSQIPT